MKKLITIMAMLSIALFVGSTAYAASVSDTIAVSLAVGEQFTMVLEKNTIDLGTIEVGQPGGDGLTVYCGTNRGLPWRVDVKATQLTGAATSATIPYSEYTYTTYTLDDFDGNPSLGTFVDPPAPLAATDQAAYTGHPSEMNDTDCRFGLYITVLVPWDQIADDYSSTVTCTMTE